MNSPNQTGRVCRELPPRYPGGMSARICQRARQEPIRRKLNLSDNTNNYQVPSSLRSSFSNNNNGRASFGPSTVRRNRSRKNRNRKNRSRKNRK